MTEKTDVKSNNTLDYNYTMPVIRKWLMMTTCICRNIARNRAQGVKNSANSKPFSKERLQLSKKVITEKNCYRFYWCKMHYGSRNNLSPGDEIATEGQLMTPSTPEYLRSRLTELRCFINFVYCQSIKTHFYSAICRERIRGARWRKLGRVFTIAISSVKKFGF